MGVAPYAELTKMQVLYGVVTEGLCPVFPTGAPAWFSRLASRCWAQQPDHRCGFECLTVMLLQQCAWVRSHSQASCTACRHWCLAVKASYCLPVGGPC